MRIGYLLSAVRAAVTMGLAALFMTFGVSSASAQNYPYPVEDIAIEMAMPAERFERWWSQAPANMRNELSSLPLGKWGPTALCDVLGFRVGTSEGVECREKKYAERMSTADQWNADGSYKGPSEQCLARNKSDKWGRLICD